MPCPGGVDVCAESVTGVPDSPTGGDYDAIAIHCWVPSGPYFTSRPSGRCEALSVESVRPTIAIPPSLATATFLKASLDAPPTVLAHSWVPSGLCATSSESSWPWLGGRSLAKLGKAGLTRRD